MQKTTLFILIGLLLTACSKEEGSSFHTSSKSSKNSHTNSTQNKPVTKNITSNNTQKSIHKALASFYASQQFKKLSKTSNYEQLPCLMLANYHHTNANIQAAKQEIQACLETTKMIEREKSRKLEERQNFRFDYPKKFAALDYKFITNDLTEILIELDSLNHYSKTKTKIYFQWREKKLKNIATKILRYSYLVAHHPSTISEYQLQYLPLVLSAKNKEGSFPLVSAYQSPKEFIVDPLNNIQISDWDKLAQFLKSAQKPTAKLIAVLNRIMERLVDMSATKVMDKFEIESRIQILESITEGQMEILAKPMQQFKFSQADLEAIEKLETELNKPSMWSQLLELAHSLVTFFLDNRDLDEQSRMQLEQIFQELQKRIELQLQQQELQNQAQFSLLEQFLQINFSAIDTDLQDISQKLTGIIHSLEQLNQNMLAKIPYELRMPFERKRKECVGPHSEWQHSGNISKAFLYECLSNFAFRANNFSSDPEISNLLKNNQKSLQSFANFSKKINAPQVFPNLPNIHDWNQGTKDYLKLALWAKLKQIPLESAEAMKEFKSIAERVEAAITKIQSEEFLQAAIQHYNQKLNYLKQTVKQRIRSYTEDHFYGIDLEQFPQEIHKIHGGTFDALEFLKREKGYRIQQNFEVWAVIPHELARVNIYDYRLQKFQFLLVRTDELILNSGENLGPYKRYYYRGNIDTNAMADFKCKGKGQECFENEVRQKIAIKRHEMIQTHSNSLKELQLSQNEIQQNAKRIAFQFLQKQKQKLMQTQFWPNFASDYQVNFEELDEAKQILESILKLPQHKDRELGKVFHSNEFFAELKKNHHTNYQLDSQNKEKTEQYIIHEDTENTLSLLKAFLAAQ